MKILFLAFARIAGVIFSLLFWFVPGFRYAARCRREKHPDAHWMRGTSTMGATLAIAIIATAYFGDSRIGGPVITVFAFMYAIFGFAHMQRVMRLHDENIWLDGPEKPRPVTV
ncbi:MAG TPA: hypothetical protein VIR98_03515 [Candidatus Paceibacterota bacterium]|jgi:hypothetical protein